MLASCSETESGAGEGARPTTNFRKSQNIPKDVPLLLKNQTQSQGGAFRLESRSTSQDEAGRGAFCASCSCKQLILFGK